MKGTPKNWKSRIFITKGPLQRCCRFDNSVAYPEVFINGYFTDCYNNKKVENIKTLTLTTDEHSIDMGDDWMTLITTEDIIKKCIELHNEAKEHPQDCWFQIYIDKDNLITPDIHWRMD